MKVCESGSSDRKVFYDRRGEEKPQGRTGSRKWQRYIYKLNFKSLLWRIFFLLLGLGMLGDNTFYGIVISIYAILTILSSFETILLVNSTSGAVTVISFVIFEKAKAIECKDYINLLITGHLSDTNVREQNMKLMDNADKNTEKIIDALKK